MPVARLSDYASSRLRMLCYAARFGDETTKVVETFRSLISPWGDRSRVQSSDWVSDISDDNTPIEFSVAIAGEKVEVRVLFEPQADVPTVAAHREVGIDFNERLENEFGASLHQFRKLKDIFLPKNMQGPFAVWSSAVFSPGKAPAFKAYLNPQAQGVEEAPEVVLEGLARLGLRHTWQNLTKTVLRRGPELDELKYFALDLSKDAEARVKVYVRHHATTAEELEVASSAASSYVRGETLDFVRSIRGNSDRLRERAPFTCSSFVGTERNHPLATTIYVPVCAYANDDAAVLDRVRTYMDERQMPSSTYESIVWGFANRPLTEGVGMQPWIALRRFDTVTRMTIYLATEANRVHPPGPIPAPTPERTAARSWLGDGSTTMPAPSAPKNDVG
jgi:DMATS type aromatic prenyltransferase